jgi:tRNA dimethylallyltransferase
MLIFPDMAVDAAEKRIFAIAGPTASGKSELGVKLAHKVGGEIINCDSVQIYRGIQIATAKPTADEMGGVPHHLIDYVDPNINYTAADWATDATRVIMEIEARGRIPILVGGTGFYLRALKQPLFDSPPTDLDLRERLRGIHRQKGASHLHKLLARVDPAIAGKLEPNDYVRVVRAIEVFFQTGRRMSALHGKRAEPPSFASRIQIFVLEPDRELLYEKINQRTEQHFSSGLVDEVKMLLDSGVREDTNALGAHAYRRVCEYLRGERDLTSAIERSKQDVRNYAKRQLTWFRREPGAVWLKGFGGETKVWNELLRQVNLE